MKGSVDKVLAQFYPVSLKISSVVGLFYSCWYRKRPHFVVLKASLWSMEKVGKISCMQSAGTACSKEQSMYTSCQNSKTSSIKDILQKKYNKSRIFNQRTDKLFFKMST